MQVARDVYHAARSSSTVVGATAPRGLSFSLLRCAMACCRTISAGESAMGLLRAGVNHIFQ